MAKALCEPARGLPGGIDDSGADRADVQVAVADQARLDAQELIDPVLPLVEQLFCMHQHQGGLLSTGDDSQGHDGLTRTRARLQYAELTAKDSLHRLHLVGPELTTERITTGGKHQPPVVYLHRAILPGHGHDGLSRTPGQHQGLTFLPPEVQVLFIRIEPAAHLFGLQCFRVLHGKQIGQLRVQYGWVTGQPDFV